MTQSCGEQILRSWTEGEVYALLLPDSYPFLLNHEQWSAHMRTHTGTPTDVLKRLHVLSSSLKTVDLTLWNQLVDKISELQQTENPVVTISNVRVSDYQGTLGTNTPSEDCKHFSNMLSPSPGVSVTICMHFRHETSVGSCIYAVLPAGVSLSTVSRSVVQINPETEEAEKLRAWFASEGKGASTKPVGDGIVGSIPGR